MKGRCYLPLIRVSRTRLRATALAVVLSLAVATASVVALTINLTYDPDSTFLDAGLSSTDIVNMKAAASYAALQFSNDLSDGVNVNIRVTAVPGTGTLGQSTTLLTSVSDYAALRTAVAANASPHAAVAATRRSFRFQKSMGTPPKEAFTVDALPEGRVIVALGAS